MRTCSDRTDARLARRATRAKKDDSRGTTGVSRGAFPPRDLPLPKPRVNFNTTDATTGATSPNMIQGVGEYVHAPTALLLPAQNNDTHRMSNRLAPISGHDGMVGSRGRVSRCRFHVPHNTARTSRPSLTQHNHFSARVSQSTNFRVSIWQLFNIVCLTIGQSSSEHVTTPLWLLLRLGSSGFVQIPSVFLKIRFRPT